MTLRSFRFRAVVDFRSECLVPRRDPRRAKSLGAVLLEALEPRQLLSTTWYVATTGSNTNPGTITRPFQTIQHAANVAQPGDTVDIFGGTYREQVTPPRGGSAGKPITYTAYQGQNVTIDGANPITGWTKYSGDIYQAPMSWTLGTNNDQVFVDGKAMTLARWPNTTSLTSPTLAVVQGGSTATVWSHHTANPQAMEPVVDTPGVPADRIAAAYYGQTFDVPLKITDGKTHKVELYMTDYDAMGRVQTVQVIDNATSQVLSTQTVSNFANGIWLIYNISGNVTFRFTATAGPDALLSGLLIDPSTAPNPTAAHPDTATLVGTDTTTQGNWRGVYGSQGQYIAGGPHTLASWATAFSTQSYIIDNNLVNSGSNWVGATIQIEAGQGWVMQTGTVIDRVGNRLYYTLPYLTAATPIDIYGAIAGNAYYLTGSFQALDSPGEWFRDPTSGKLYLWMPAGDSPATHLVEAKARDYAFFMAGLSYINIDGITLQGCTIDAKQSTNININGITADYLSQFTTTGSGWDIPINTGIELSGNNDSITNSVIAYSAGDGIVLNGSYDVARNNIVHDVDYSGSDAAGILATGSHNIIDHNTVYEVGRDGILFSNSTQTQVTYNYIYTPMQQGDDGGGLYTFGTDGTGSAIAYNIITDVHSPDFGGQTILGGSGFGANGIFLDNGCTNYTIDHNVVTNSDAALKLNPPSHTENVFNNDLIGTAFSVETGGDFDLTGSIFDNNVLVGVAQIPPNAFQSGNVATGDEAGTFVAGSSLPGGQ
jgi:hypothetical protein